MYYAQHSPGVAHKLADHQPWPRQAPSSQQPPGYALFTHPHSIPLAHHHHHQNSLTSLNHYPSPPQMGSPAGQIMTQHWQQQLLKCEMVRSSRSPHHRARASAMASRSVTKTAIPITNPNKLEEPVDADHPSSTVAPVAPRITAKTPPENNWNSLDMGGVNIKSIPPTSGLFSFTFLTTLYLNHNALETVPPQISALRHLELLDISGNNLSHLPPELGMLTSLKEFYFFDNHVSTIPFELGTLHQLQTIGIEGNPLDPYLKNMVQKDGTRALISHLRDNGTVAPHPPDRQWKLMEPPGTGAGAGGEAFSVICYNILCERCATERMYGYTPNWALQWDYRKDFIINEIVSQSADFLCLQEVDVGQYEDFFMKRLGEYKYEGVFWPKSRAKTMSDTDRRLVDGCATFYNAARFKLVESHLIEFNAVAMRRADFKKTDDMFNRVLGKDHIAVVCLLEDIHTGTRYIIANTHLFWDLSFSDVKLVQVALLVDEIEQIAKSFAAYPPPPGVASKYTDGSKIPLILCGDFNSVPDSGVYEFVRDGVLSAKHQDFLGHVYGRYTDEGLKHRLNLKSAYCGPTGETLPFTNYTPSFKGVIDYIWYSTVSVSVSAVLGEQDHEYMDKVVGLPNTHYPSDHICISAKFRVKPPAAPTNGNGQIKSIPPTP